MTGLANDIARCNGYSGDQLCTECERKAQIQRDDPAAFFWVMGPAVTRGRCVFFIGAPAETKEVQR